jgi:hypothetical protein
MRFCCVCVCELCWNSVPADGVQYEAAWALTNVASGTHEHADELVRLGVVPIFVSLLGHGNVEARDPRAHTPLEYRITVVVGGGVCMRALRCFCVWCRFKGRRAGGWATSLATASSTATLSCAQASRRGSLRCATVAAARGRV